MSKRFLFFLSSFLLLPLCLNTAKADVSLLLHEAVVGLAGEATSAGHLSLYFSNICMDGPTSVRMCKAGEAGVVISSYPKFGTTKEYQWVLIPLLPFLYGVERAEDVPLFANGKMRALMRERMRQTYFRDIVPAPVNGKPTPGDWQALVAATVNKDIYGITVRTTIEQDQKFVDELMRKPNESRFDALYYNCADFTRDILNLYFPGATHRDPLNDFTMTTPKAIARTFTSYASKRPELMLHIVKYSQLHGPSWLSQENRNFSEHAFKSRKYIIPELIFKPIIWPIFMTSYYAFGYFDINRAYHKYGSMGLAELHLAEWQFQRNLPSAGVPVVKRKADALATSALLAAVNWQPEYSAGRGSANSADANDKAGEGVLSKQQLKERQNAERARLFGTNDVWLKYRQEYARLRQTALQQGYFVDEKEFKTFFKDLELQSTPDFDEDGQPYLKVRDYGVDKVLGVTRKSILSETTDAQLAYKLLLVRVNRTLNAAEKNREMLNEFLADWELLQTLRERCARLPEPGLAVHANQQKRFLEKPEVVSGSMKFKKTFVRIAR